MAGPAQPSCSGGVSGSTTGSWPVVGWVGVWVGASPACWMVVGGLSSTGGVTGTSPVTGRTVQAGADAVGT